MIKFILKIYKKKDIPANIPSNSLQILLQSQPGLGNVLVSRSGTCYGYSYDIKWVSGGFKPLLQVIIIYDLT
jgi:hypothetical protein